MPAILLLMSAGLALLAGVSLRYQYRNLQRLRSETLPSDDRRYLRGLCQRRTLNAILILALAGLLAGAYFSGGLEELGRLSRVKQPDMTDQDRENLRGLVIYWIVVLGMLFFVLVVAIADYTATGLYGRQQLQRIREEQAALLERDLAMYRQQKLNERMKGLS